MTTTNDPENYPRSVRAGEIIGHTTPDTTPSPGAHPRPAWQREVLSQRATLDLEQADKAHRSHDAADIKSLASCGGFFIAAFVAIRAAMHLTTPAAWATFCVSAPIALALLIYALREKHHPKVSLRDATDADCTAAASAHRYVCEAVGRLPDDEIDSWISRLTLHRDRLRKINDDTDRLIAPSTRARLDSAATAYGQTLDLLRRKLSNRARIDT